MVPGPSFRELVEGVRELPYGRPSDRTVEGMLREGQGTCSTKHLFLARELERLYPWTDPRIVHRVYTLAPGDALERYGQVVAGTVPAGGVVDVHRYLTVRIGDRRVVIDATFPSGDRWDGISSMPLACGPGEDHPAGSDPDLDKRRLEARYCDPGVREAFIEALGSSADGGAPEGRRYPARFDAPPDPMQS